MTNILMLLSALPLLYRDQKFDIIVIIIVIIHVSWTCFRAETATHMLDQWTQTDKYSLTEFELIEPVLSMRCSVLFEVAQRKKDVNLQRSLMDSIEKQARLAREAGLLQVGNKCNSGNCIC